MVGCHGILTLLFRGMPMHSFLFLHTVVAGPDLSLCPREVAAAWWVPLSLVSGRDRVQSLALPLSSMPWKASSSSLLRHFFGVSTLTFPCIPLPHPPPGGTTVPLEAHQTILWGLTMGVVTEVLVAGGQAHNAPTDCLRQRTWLLGDASGRPIRNGAAPYVTSVMR